MKSATKRAARPLVDIVRRAELQHAAVLHHRDPVGHRQRLLLVVGDQHEGDAGLALDALQLDLHAAPQLQVERRQRLVEQQQARAGASARASATRCCWPPDSCDGRRSASASSRTSAQHLAPPGASTSAPRDPAARRPKPTFCGDRHMREQRVGLEHRVDRPLVRRVVDDVLARRAGCRRKSGARSRRAAAASVVLPQPEGPSSVKNSFERISSETSSRAFTAVGPVPKTLDTFWISTSRTAPSGAAAVDAAELRATVCRCSPTVPLRRNCASARWPEVNACIPAADSSS